MALIDDVNLRDEWPTITGSPLTMDDIRAAVDSLRHAPPPAFKRHGAYLMPVHPENVDRAVQLHLEGRLQLICTACGGPLVVRGDALVCAAC
jgi:hypothetical protein